MFISQNSHHWVILILVFTNIKDVVLNLLFPVSLSLTNALSKGFVRTLIVLLLGPQQKVFYFLKKLKLNPLSHRNTILPSYEILKRKLEGEWVRFLIRLRQPHFAAYNEISEAGRKLLRDSSFQLPRRSLSPALLFLSDCLQGEILCPSCYNGG